MENLRVTLVQSFLHWEDKSANLRQFDQKLASLAGQTDLIILPEMFSTGFSMNATALAEDMQGRTMQWLRDKAAILESGITGSFIAEENGHYYNRLVWMHPDGTYSTYDKRHLFTYADEHQHYTPGQQPLLVELKGWRILPLICYDLRFPVWSRNVQNYDLLLYVANFPERRSHAWKSLLTARAIENLAYTIGVNRVGNDGNEISHSGDSMLIDYAGQTLYQISHLEDIFTATLSYQALQEFRQRFAFLQDRDHFTISNP
ncbi:MAG: amidohydrolase [Saprospiraceae bacterium]|nr:amidohydrolase [Saprospiraceae bacterium]